MTEHFYHTSTKYKHEQTTDSRNSDNILLNQENVSVLNNYRSEISTSKLPAKNVETRQCKGLLGYVNQFQKLLVDKTTELICRKSKHSPRQFCLPRNWFIWTFVAHYYSQLSYQCSAKTPICLKLIVYLSGIHKWIRTLTKSCRTLERINELEKMKTLLPVRKKWKVPYPFHSVHLP